MDPRNGGDREYKALLAMTGPLPLTLKVKTGGGGFHLYFRADPRLKSCKLAEGIDFLADKKMSVLPPSIHPETGVAYIWETPPDTPIAVFPPAWVERVSAQKSSLPEPFTPAVVPSNKIKKGQRNNTLTAHAGKLQRVGKSRQVILTALLEMNTLHAKPPLDEREVTQIVDSLMRYSDSKSLKTKWQEAMWTSDLHDRTKITLSLLAMHANEEGKECYPNQDDLAAMRGCTRQTIASHLEKVDGLWLKRYKRYRDKGPGFSYGYILILPKEE